MLQAQVNFTEVSSWLPNHWESDHPVCIVDMNGDNLDDIVLLDDGKDLVIYFQNAAGQSFTEYVYPAGGGGGGSAWGMCAADADEDGYADVLYGGSFNDVTYVQTNNVETDYSETDLGISLFLQGINFADIDNDGNLDIFACDDVGPSQIYLGDGQGNFVFNNTVLVTAIYGGGEDDSGNYGSVWTDIDNDGDIDLYIAKCRQGVVDPADPRRINQLFINNGDGTYTEDAASWNINSGEQTWSADFGDIDNDGDMDLLLGQHTNEPVEVYENDGNGNFTNITTAAGLDGAFSGYVIQSKFADFDNDGFMDIYVAGANLYLIAMNNGDNTFDVSNQTNIGCEVNSFALGDLNSDGFMDMYCTPFGYGAWNPNGSDSVYINDGNSNNHLTITLNGIVSNPDAVGARVSIYGPWGVQVREVRSGESYGIQNTFNLMFGLGTATSTDSVVIDWPSGITDVHYNLVNDKYEFFEGSLVGDEELEANKIETSIYPNPANEQALLSINGFENFDQTVNVVLYSITGKVVATQRVTATNTVISRGDLAAGMYSYTVEADGEAIATGKLIFR